MPHRLAGAWRHAGDTSATDNVHLRVEVDRSRCSTPEPSLNSRLVHLEAQGMPDRTALIWSGTTQDLDRAERDAVEQQGRMPA